MESEMATFPQPSLLSGTNTDKPHCSKQNFEVAALFSVQADPKADANRIRFEILRNREKLLRYASNAAQAVAKLNGRKDWFRLPKPRLAGAQRPNFDACLGCFPSSYDLCILIE
ncbi:hypothetical protein AVEN_100748-1 [Araneus ventricosus]|uniref:Uncharacterized protein n=1 Tax=Araneus ventricosus TaxID=182803 RepID=A0A4Y2GNH4_ARAVE|nr:hypothetical protein AVEN_100748-1 [Araneus ventricosus]